MNRISVAAAAIAALATAACQQSGANNSAEGVQINGARIGETIENGLKDGVNYARDAGNVIGNELAPAGNAIGNGAKAAWNEGKEVVRDIRNSVNGGGANTNTTGN